MLASASKPKALLVITKATICLFCLLLGPATRADPDFGVSLNLLVKADLENDWFIISRSNLATRDNNGELFFGYAGAALGFQFTDSASLRIGYRQARLKVGAQWQREDRPFVELFSRFDANDWRFSNRARVEFRFFDYRDDDIRLRNEIALEAPARLTPLALQPFLEEEIFYALNANRVEANWLTLGLSWRPFGGAKLKAGFRWNRFRIGDEWRDRDVLVLGFNRFF